MGKKLVCLPFLIFLFEFSIASATPVDPLKLAESVTDKSICRGEQISVEKFLDLLDQDTGELKFTPWVYQRKRLRIGETFGTWKPLIGSSYLNMPINLTLAVKANSATVAFSQLLNFNWAGDEYWHTETLSCGNLFDEKLKWERGSNRSERGKATSIFDTLKVVDLKITSSCIWAKLANEDSTSENYVYYIFE
jgi:hypothetical protein